MSYNELNSGLAMEVGIDTATYALTKGLIGRDGGMLRKLDTSDVVSYVIGDLIYTMGVRGTMKIGGNTSPAVASGGDEFRKAMIIGLTQATGQLLLPKMMDNKVSFGKAAVDIALSVGASSLVSNFVVDPLVGPMGGKLFSA